MSFASKLIELPALRDRVEVFKDRADAGRTLAEMMEIFKESRAIVLAIPSGGVPVARVLADSLELELDVAAVSKITLPWNSETGYGAVAFDGTTLMNEALIRSIGLSTEEIERGTRATHEKVSRRAALFRGDRPFPSLAERPTILVDDGLASGFTMLTAVTAVRAADASEIIVAVPTGNPHSIRLISEDVDTIYCPNVRTGPVFAVADAYRHWYDVSEQEVSSHLSRKQNSTATNQV